MASVRYITRNMAQKIDADLFNIGYSLDQLMELAGKSVADIINVLYESKKYPTPVFFIGPGNNGGDALVASRYLKQYGYDPFVYIPKWPSKFPGLVSLCEAYEIGIIKDSKELVPHMTKNTLVVDGLFGFSFEGEIRPPYDSVLREMRRFKGPLVSIDVPSGWDIDATEQINMGEKLKPETLISLTLPKICAKGFQGKHHALAGSFVPKTLQNRLDIETPCYGTRSFILLNSDI